MAIDYKKELENAAKSMILIHDPNVLIKMIVRMIVQKVKLKHAGILLHHKEKDTYILTFSRGRLGLKIPAGFARMDTDNPLVRFFKERKDRDLFNDGAMVYEEAQKLLDKDMEDELRQLLKSALYQMEIFEAIACIPTYFRDDLLGILLMGSKQDGERFLQEELDFLVALASDVAMAIRNAQLFKELELELQKKNQLFIHTTMALAAAIDAKDHYTWGHISRVTELSLMIAKVFKQKNIKAVDDKFLEHLYIAGLLHDIGKIGIPESILNKEEKLTDEERRLIKEHSLIGVKILEPIQELGDAILGVKYHHERYDGAGYPEGLKGNQIPLIASIISVADAFDAMITDRPYRRALSKEKAIEEIKSLGGQQFEPQVALVMVELYQEGKI
jgi:HD-GYP domain-containing protein (c-di-GMP phosphodiesterase class II)